MDTTEQLPEGNSDASETDVMGKLEAMFDDGPETPKNEGQEAQADGPEQTEGETPKDSNEVEIEVDGSTYRVPKELKDAVLRHADYTQKTQEVAAARRAIDAQMRMLQERQQFEQATAAEQNQLRQLEVAIQQYSNVDMSTMDTDSMLKTKMYLDNLKEARANLAQGLEAKRGQFRSMQDQYLASIRDAGEQALKTTIPKWGAEVKQELARYGEAEGFTQDELANLVDHRMVRTLWKAAQYDKLVKANPQVNKRAQEPQRVVKPGATSPQVSDRVDRMNYGKAMKNAKTQGEKNALIAKRLERLV